MYRYYCLYRPPMPGTVPRGMSTMTTFDERRYVDEIKREAWGSVDYDIPLTPQQIIRYELAVPIKNNDGCNNDFCEF